MNDDTSYIYNMSSDHCQTAFTADQGADGPRVKMVEESSGLIR